MFRKLSCHFKNIVDSAQKWQPHFCLHVQAKWVLLYLRFYYITNTVRKNTLRQGHTVISTINLFLFTRDATYLHRYRDWLTQKSMNKRNKSSFLLSFLCLFKWIQIKKNKLYLPGTGPQTLGIISKMAEQDGSSKHNCLAKMQFSIAIAVFMFWPAKIRKMKENVKISSVYK